MKPQTYLQQITGVSIYPIITLLIFFLLFVSVALYLKRSKPSHFDALSTMPLDEELNDEISHS
jgi:hypothetical protein